MNFFEELKKYFETTPREKVLEDWEKSKQWDDVAFPTYDYYTTRLKQYAEKQLIMDFLEWTVEDWSGSDRLGDSDVDVIYICDDSGNTIVDDLDEIDFKSNWNYLMCAIDKIKTIGDIGFTNPIDYLPNIDNTYEGVLNWIRYYNGLEKSTNDNVGKFIVMNLHTNDFFKDEMGKVSVYTTIEDARDNIGIYELEFVNILKIIE